MQANSEKAGSPKGSSFESFISNLESTSFLAALQTYICNTI